MKAIIKAIFQKTFTKLSGLKFMASITTPINLNENLLYLSGMNIFLILIKVIRNKKPRCFQHRGFSLCVKKSPYRRFKLLIKSRQLTKGDNTLEYQSLEIHRTQDRNETGCLLTIPYIH